MRRWPQVALTVGLLATSAVAAPKSHVIVFGRWQPVKLFAGAGEKTSIELKVRTLSVDGRLREFTLGEPHEVTDRLFVVRRAFRVNDSLPASDHKPPDWKWQQIGRASCRERV